MQLIVGLGNPGAEYASTRHNAGFRVVERFAERHALHFDFAPAQSGEVAQGEALLPGGRREVVLLKPATYMNRAGRSVRSAVESLGIRDLRDELVLVYDDLDLAFGRLRVRPRGSAGGHRGVADVQACLGSDEFPRLRFGIGRPQPGGDPVAYVLEPFAADEERALAALLDRATDALEMLIDAGTTAAMDHFNASPVDDSGDAAGLR